jgi:hypothetical protein
MNFLKELLAVSKIFVEMLVLEGLWRALRVLKRGARRRRGTDRLIAESPPARTSHRKDALLPWGGPLRPPALSAAGHSKEPAET